MPSTLEQVDMPNALTRYCIDNEQSPTVEINGDFDNCWQLPPPGHRTGYTTLNNIQWFHPVLAKPTANQVIVAYDNWLAQLQVESAEAQAIQTVLNNAEGQAAAIPNWAGWTEAQVLTWFDTNVTNLLPAANLAAANVIVTNMATAQRAMARMLVALRNKAWPNMQD